MNYDKLTVLSVGITDKNKHGVRIIESWVIDHTRYMNIGDVDSEMKEHLIRALIKTIVHLNKK